MLGGFIRYGNSILLTRILGAQTFGLYAVANTVILVLSVPSVLGLPAAVSHFVATYEGTGQWGRLRWVVRASLRTAVLSTLVGTVLLLLVSPWASSAVFHKEGLVLPLLGLTLALPCLGLYAVCAGGLQGLRRIREFALIERIAHPLLFSVLLVLGGFYFRELWFVLACFFAAAVVTASLAAYWFFGRLKDLPKPEAPAPASWGELWNFSLPVMALNLLQFFLLHADVLVMGMFRPAAEVGIYTIASRLALGVAMPVDALGASTAPNFSSLVGRGDREGLRRLFHTTTRWTCLAGTGIGLVLVLGGKPLLALFGKDFQAGYVVLCLVAAGQMVSALFGANGTLITRSGHPKVNLVNALFLGLGNLGLNLYLVPRFGAVGAAASAGGSMVVLNLVRTVQIRWLHKIGPWDRTILKPLAIFAGSALAGGAVSYWAHPIAGAAVGFGSFVLLWRLLGPEEEDWDMLLRAWAKLRRSPSQDGE